MVLNSRHNFAKITKIVDHATLVHTASLLTVWRTMIFTVARLYDNLSGPSELRTLNQNLSSSQFQSPAAPSPAPSAMRRAESELCTMWLQTGSCSAAMRGICTRAHSLNELSSHRPSPHPSYFNVSGRVILVNIITESFQEAPPSQHNPYRMGAMGPISSRQSPFVAGPSPTVKKPVKMVMCVNYNNSGHCDRGETCTYAHGLDELHEYRMKQVSVRPSRILHLWLRQDLKESLPVSVRLYVTKCY